MGINITSYCRIKNNYVEINGTEFPVSSQPTAASFLTEFYKSLGLNYPKFYKMDTQCKLGLLAAEAALKSSGFQERNKPENTGIILANKASSLDTDRIHQQSIQNPSNYLPSPSVFVYTLPNIVIGEISIKYKITGENAFFVHDLFDAQLLYGQNIILLNQGAVTGLISGWVDYDNGCMDALIYLAEKTDDSIKNSNFKPLNELTIKQLYS